MRSYLFVLSLFLSLIGIKAQIVSFETALSPGTLNTSHVFGEKFYRSYYLTNTGTAVFNGQVSYKNQWQSGVQVNKITFSSVGATVSLPGGGTSITPTDNGVYYFNIANLNILASNDRVLITEEVQIIGCLGPDGSASVVDLKYCDNAGANCQNVNNAYNNSTGLSLITPIVSKPTSTGMITGIDPATDKQDGYYYNTNTATCSGTGSGKRRRQVSLSTGNIPLTDFYIEIGIRNYNDKMYSFIAQTSLKVYRGSESPENEISSEFAIDPDLIYSTSVQSPCIAQFEIFDLATLRYLGVVPANEQFIVTFDEYYCCPLIEDFAEKVNQSWFFHAQGKDHCGATITNMFNGATPRLKELSGLNTTYFYIQSPLNLFGPRSGQPIRDIGKFELQGSFNKTTLQELKNMNFNINQAQLQVVMKLDPGLRYIGNGSGYQYAINTADQQGEVPYQNLQFRQVNNAANVWSSVSSNYSYSDPLGQVGASPGQFLRAHSFNFNFSDIPLATPSDIVRNVWQYMNSSELLYSLEPECVPNPESRYQLEFYLLPYPECSSCRIPLDSIQRSLAVMCPGCLFPGGAGSECTFKRLTMGKQDLNNNMLADIPNTPATSDPNLYRLNFGVLGDIVEVTSAGYLTSPSPCGINEMVDDDYFGPLKYAYLSMTVSHGDFYSVIVANGLDIELTRNSISYPIHISAADVNTILLNRPDDANPGRPFFFDLSLTTLKTLGYLDAVGFPGASDNTFRYMSGDGVRVVMKTRITKNTDTGDHFLESLVRNELYFSTEPDASNANGAALLMLDCANNQYTNLSDFENDTSKQNFLCEAYFGGFNLVGIYKETKIATTLDYQFDDSRNGCQKTLVFDNTTTIGKDIVNIFRNEFRAVPELGSFEFALPKGYFIDPALSQSIRITSGMYQPANSGVGYDMAVNSVDISTQASSFLGSTSDLSPKYLIPLTHTPLTTDNPAEVPPGQLLDGDELSFNRIWVRFTPICTLAAATESFPDVVSNEKRPRVNYASFPGQSGVVTDYAPAVPLIDLTRPAADLNLNFLGTGNNVIVSDPVFIKQFEIVNYGGPNMATNPYLIIEFDPAKIGAPLVREMPSANLLSIVASGSNFVIYKLRSDNTIAPNATFLYQLEASYNCGSNFDASTINMKYGWDCATYPTTPTAPSCFSDSLSLIVTPATIAFEQSITSIDNGTCNKLSIHYLITQNNPGAMDNITFHVDLPPGLELAATNRVAIKYGDDPDGDGVGFPLELLLDNILTIDAANGVYDIKLKSLGDPTGLNSPFKATSGFNNQILLTVNAQYNGVCGVYNPTTPVLMSFTSTSYCGSPLGGNNSLTSTMNQCGDISITVLPGNIVCPDQNVTLTANAPAGSSFQWLKDGTVIPLATSASYSFVSSSIAGSSVYSVNVDGSTFCGSKSVTITVVSRPIVDFTTPPEYCFGTTYPLNGTPSGGVFSGVGVTLVGSQYQFSSSTAIEHSITYTYTDPATGCVGTITKVITPSGCCPYRLDPINVFCGTNDIHCVQLRAVRPVSDGIKGMDFVLRYNANRLTPIITGGNLEVTFGNVVLSGINPSMVDIAYNIMPSTSNIRDLHLSIFYNSNAPSNADWAGIGEVVCVKFRINAPNVGALTTVRIGVINNSTTPIFGYTDEEHTLSTQTWCVENNGSARVEVIQNPMLNGIVRFHNTSSTLKYDVANPTSFNLTTIATSSNTCTPLAPGVSTTPDMTGAFAINMTGTQRLIFDRDIAGDYSSANCNAPATDLLNVMTAMNGYDSYLMESISTLSYTSGLNLTQDRGVPDPNGTTLSEPLRKATFPTPYQMIAADVNMSGSIRANDITWLQQRSVSKICEFPQTWNYTEATNPATPITPGLKSYDWKFTNKTGTRSANYPLLGGATSADFFTGYWRDKVPVTSGCITFPILGTNLCRTYPTTQEIYAVLLGDMDGSWRGSVSHQNTLRTATDNQVVLDYTAMVRTGNSTYRIPVSFDSEDTTVSLDFVLNYDENKMKILGVENAQEGNDQGARMIFNDFNASELALSSYTMNQFHTGRNIYYLDVLSLDGNMDAAYLGSGAGFLNGRRVPLHIEGIATSTTDANIAIQQFEVVPNPSNGVAQINYNVVSDMEAQIMIYNNLGQIVSQYEGISGSGSISLESLNMANGMYQAILKHSNKQEVIKIVVSK